MNSGKMVDRAARDDERQQVLGKGEWCRRFADRVQQRAGGDRNFAEQYADECWPEAEKEQRQCPQWEQVSPEDWADEEMSCWGE